MTHWIRFAFECGSCSKWTFCCLVCLCCYSIIYI